MSDYYKFWSHFKAYKCQCPDLKDGDECNECMSNSKTHTYITESKTCKKCKCSDLSLSKSCDDLTAQCRCRPANMQRLAGTNCVSYKECNSYKL